MISARAELLALNEIGLQERLRVIQKILHYACTWSDAESISEVKRKTSTSKLSESLRNDWPNFYFRQNQKLFGFLSDELLLFPRLKMKHHDSNDDFCMKLRYEMKTYAVPLSTT